MVNTDRLKGEIIARKLKQKDVYERIGLSKRQWELRMDSKKFDSDEIYKICEVLGNEVLPIFFETADT